MLCRARPNLCRYIFAGSLILALTNIYAADPAVPAARSFQKRRAACAILAAAFAVGVVPAYNYFTPGTPAEQLTARLQHNSPKAHGPLTITHLAQQHYSPQGQYKPEVFASTIRSQELVMARLRRALQNGTPAVFNEGNRTDLTRAEWEKHTRAPAFPIVRTTDGIKKVALDGFRNRSEDAAYVAIARSLFPAGLPKGAATSWTPEQQFALFRLGAANLLWATGELAEVYAGEDRDASLLGFFANTQLRGRTQALYASREIAALGNLVQVSLERSPSEWLVVYGAKHDFAQYERENLTFQREDFFIPPK